MGQRFVMCATGTIWCAVLLGILAGCADRRSSTSASDQTFVPGPPPRAEAPVAKEPRVTEPPIRAVPVPSPPPAQPTPLPVAVADVYFDFDQYRIRADAESVLKANARVLNEDHTAKILIEGHCDERGTSAYNMVLGERRANAAKRYLEDLGVLSTRMHIVSYGKERPFCTDRNEACWQSNRRAHFRLP